MEKEKEKEIFLKLLKELQLKIVKYENDCKLSFDSLDVSCFLDDLQEIKKEILSLYNSMD